MSRVREQTSVSIVVNGKNYTVDAATTSLDTSLNTFLRTTAQLRGTKFMCLEGGCGACIVVVRGFHPVERQYKSWSVNSCLTPILACHGLEITTVEGIGNRVDGYHAVQKRLTAFNGTQCGYCSPGMVMNMVGLLDANGGQVTMAEVENSFGGNMCRCTGYRPILDAFKSLAVDADEKLRAQCATADIEDLPKRCPSSGRLCEGLCRKGGADTRVRVKSTTDGREWNKVFYMEELFDVLQNIGSAKYMLVAGNTAHGVYRRDASIQQFIHISDIEELRRTTVTEDRIVLGACVSLTEMMSFLASVAESKPAMFAYCKHLVTHVDFIANVPVRNSGTIGGNLSIKHDHKEFPSDLYLILETVGAQLTIAESLNKSCVVSVRDYMDVAMRGKVLLNVLLPPLPADTFTFRSFKIMPRAQNAHAYVNAGFLIESDDTGCVRSARICFGGIDPQFTHAVATEKLLVGTVLHCNETLQLALRTLQSELHADWVLPDASPAYRTQLALSLFYKFVLATAPAAGATVLPQLLSGGDALERPLSSGRQEFDTVPENYPLTEPVPKYEGLIQTSGEAEFVNDMPTLPNELYAAFVPGTEVNATVAEVVGAEALAIPGVHRILTAADIPGANNFHPLGDVEEILLGKDSPVLYHGQPVAIIVADSFDLANAAAHKVLITYAKPAADVKQSIIPTLHDAHVQKATDRYGDLPYKMTATEYGAAIGAADSASVVGVFDIGTQYHYTMEPQTAVCAPAEDGLNVYSATQWVDFGQMAIAGMLKMPNNEINMQLRRLGGGYGAKGTRSAHIACAAALACYHTRRPVRFVMSLESNMAVVGRRYALLSEYEAQVDSATGRIQRLDNRFAQDYGSSLNEPCPQSTVMFMGNCYATQAWDVSVRSVRTNAPGHTYCRAPGSTEGIAMTENLMEHIARVTGVDPLAVRLANMQEAHPIRELLPAFLSDCDFEERQRAVRVFNAANRWHKRGIAVVPMDYAQEYFGNLQALVAIYHADGTVAVTHAGIECGQGINTKVAQVAAHVLGVPYDMVRVKRMDNVLGANGSCTAASRTSEAVCHAIKKACEMLLERLQAVRVEKPEVTEWSALIAAAHAMNIDLTAKFLHRSVDVKEYHTYGITCAEVELDLLTGNVQLRRVDILEDTGESISPLVDVGQVEGAFVMGLGYWLTESIVHDPLTGELLTNRTWTYKPPGAKDIPVDFRVKFLRNNPNEFGVLRSKATGEPPLCMSVVVLFALRRALESARDDAGITEKWFEMGAPCTPDVLFQLAGNSIEQYRLNDEACDSPCSPKTAERQPSTPTGFRTTGKDYFRSWGIQLRPTLIKNNRLP